MKIFITGCSSGFGNALARRLARTDEVIASDPDPVDIPGATSVQLDVRDAEQVSAVAEAVGPVDVLVNNGGYAIFNTIEEADLEAIRDLFDVNVLGVARVTQAFLPGLRARSGTIVQISSVAGRTVFPESGYYAATKYAVEAMTEALFQETCTFGVKLRLIQPGSFDTNFGPTATVRSRPRPDDSPYAEVCETWDRRKNAVLEAPQDPELVVDAIVASLSDPRPFARIPVGPDSQRIIALRDALGPDPWSRLAADRAGLRAPHQAGDVPYPEELLDHPDNLTARARAGIALAHGHLEHWEESEAGREALAFLSPRPPR